MNIPFVDLKKQYQSLKEELDISLKSVIDSSSFIKGPFLEEFEQSWAEFIGVKYSIGVASGTDALHLSLMALKISKGDEVIMPVNTFIATAYAALYLGAKPVFVDIDENTYNINVNLIEKNITKKTRAIIPVHLYGQVAEMDKIMALAKAYKLFVIEDACQAHGASFNKKNAGSFGDLAAFSFYPGKNLGAYGDGGAITTNSPDFAETLKMLREYGGISKYEYELIGINSRLDAIQAAILQVKLKHLKEYNKKRAKIAKYYDTLLKSELPFIITPHISKNFISSYHLYVIRTPERDLLIKHLLSLGIHTGIHYPYPLHLQESLKQLCYKGGDFPLAEKISHEILSLPIYPELTTSEQDYIIQSIKDFFKK